MKKFTYGDGNAVMILVAQRMGLEPGHVEDAKRQLEGGVIHPTVGKAMEGAAVEANNRLRHDESLIAQANIHVEHLKAEFGFAVDLSKEAFLALQKEAEALEMNCAQGRDTPDQDARLKVIDSIMEGSSWTLHPDYGCIPKSEVNTRDRAAMSQG